MQYNIDKLKSVRPNFSWTQSQISNIKLLSLRKNELSQTFGSAIYRMQKYAADLDLQDIFVEATTVDDVVDIFVRKIKKIVKDIKKEKLHYFSEFKAGLDLRYDVDVGPIFNGTYRPNLDLINFPKKLLNKEEIKIINKILSMNNPGENEYDILYNIFRERKVLRWTEKEIIAGKKELFGGKKMALQDALKMKSYVKIDMISFVNNQFVEITDFYILVSHDENKNITINLDYDYLDQDEVNRVKDFQLRNDIEKFFFSDYYYSPFKCSKRMWGYSRSFGLDDSVKALYPLVSGDISYLYQLTTEIGTILRVSELRKSPPQKYIDNAIDLINHKLANILVMNDENLFTANHLIRAFLKKHNYEILKELQKYLKDITNRSTIIMLNKIGYNPPPNRFLPDERKYAPIIRNIKIEHNETPNSAIIDKVLSNLKRVGGMQQIRNVYFSNERPIDGGAIQDYFIKSLPFEAHLFGTVHREPYQELDESLKKYKEGSTRRAEYTGPGTHTNQRFARGERGINDLDHAAMFHDFAYESNDPNVRNAADEVLSDAAKKYLTKQGISLLDKTDAHIVIEAMKLIHRKV